MNVVRTLPTCFAVLEVAHDDVCHLLDSAGRAYCFADLTGRRVHDTGPVADPACSGCGRARCPRCIEIFVALGGDL